MGNRLVGFLVLANGLMQPGPSLTCRLVWPEPGPTLVADLKNADMVVVAKFVRARPEMDESDFQLIEVLKPHAYLKGSEFITLPRVHDAIANPYLIYVEVVKGKLEPFRGVELTEKGKTLAYLKGALKLAEAPTAKRLEYAFAHLQSEDYETSLDAHGEFNRAGYKQYKEVAANFSAVTIEAWLQSPKTLPYRYGLYASLLGNAGHKEPSKYGQVLKDMIDDPEKRKGSGIEGMLAGYAMLQPREALEFLKRTLSNPKEDFNLRYNGCLRTARFMWEQRPDLVPEKQLLELMVMVARLPDMADFAIEDLRRWNRWETTPTILALFDAPSHDTPLIKRSILLFALHAAAQKNAEAANFVARQDTAWVEEVSRIFLESETDLKAPYQRVK